MLSQLVKKAGRAVGLDIRRHNPHLSFELSHRDLIRKSAVDMVLDVGANTGQFVRQLRNQYEFNGEVISFEPLSAARKRLLEAAQSDPRWRVMSYGLGAESSHQTLNIAGNSQSSSLLEMLPAHVQAAPDSAYVATEPVEIRRLDDVFDEIGAGGKRILLKMDVQGYEEKVLLGAEKSLDSVVAVRTEMSIVGLYDSEMVIEEMIGWLRKRGFVLRAVEPNFSDPVTGALMQVDGLFVRTP